MTSARKFYKTEIRVVLLSEEPLPDCMDLETAQYLMTEGHCSGVVEQDAGEEVTGPDMARMLKAQGSDPDFFSLDEEGNDVDEAI
jgi:hypothetical protein